MSASWCVQPLASHAQEAELSFDVLFEEDFQWTGGGKLHGLGPAHPVTGGNPRSPQKWSARAVFRPGGAVATYIYDQTPGTKYGAGRKSEGPVFQQGRWHHVQLRMRVNTPGLKDGWTRIVVDGRTVVEQDGLEFRGSGTPGTDVRTFLFSTFHGGIGPKWTPVNESGEPVTVHALFDNFEVVRLEGSIEEALPTSHRSLLGKRKLSRCAESRRLSQRRAPTREGLPASHNLQVLGQVERLLKFAESLRSCPSVSGRLGRLPASAHR